MSPVKFYVLLVGLNGVDITTSVHKNGVTRYLLNQSIQPR
jgi:hypothetical protein